MHDSRLYTNSLVSNVYTYMYKISAALSTIQEFVRACYACDAPLVVLVVFVVVVVDEIHSKSERAAAKREEDGEEERERVVLEL